MWNVYPSCANKSSYVNRRAFFSLFFSLSPLISSIRSGSLNRSIAVLSSLYQWRLFVIHLLILNHLTLIFVLHTLKMNYLNNRFLSLFRTAFVFIFIRFSFGSAYSSLYTVHTFRSPCLTFNFFFQFIMQSVLCSLLFKSKVYNFWYTHIMYCSCTSLCVWLGSLVFSRCFIFLLFFHSCSKLVRLLHFCFIGWSKKKNAVFKIKCLRLCFYVYISQILTVLMHQSSLSIYLFSHMYILKIISVHPFIAMIFIRFFGSPIWFFVWFLQ